MNIFENLVSFFGDQIKTAKALNVKQPSVNAWLSGKAGMSEKVAMRAEIATGGKFKAVDLCPSMKDFIDFQKQQTPSGH